MAQSARGVALRQDYEALAPAHLELARALEAKGRGGEAAAVYQAALRSDAASLDARLGLARIYMLLGRTVDAFVEADEALRIDGANVGAWSIVAEALSAMGETVLAIQAGARALELAPRDADLHVRFAQILETAERPFDAADAYRRGLALEPSPRPRCEALVALSGLHGRAKQFDRARTHAEAALKLDPRHQGAHQNLAAICEHQGLAQEAERHREAAYRGRSLIVTRAVRPVRRVLTLASATRANSPDRHLIPISRYDRLVWFLAYGDALPIEDYDVVFNAISDADAADAFGDRLVDVCRQINRPLLNPPEAVARTARDGAERLFQRIPGLVVPLVRRVTTSTDLDGLDAHAQWLLRPLGAHGGERVERLTLAQAARRLDGRPHYLTEFHDFRSNDAIYRKFRMFFVAGAPFPYHLAVSDDWLLHYQSSWTPHVAEYLQEERRFLEGPREVLGDLAFEAICEVGRRLNLDFAGVDFALLPDGRALLFEANATMLVHDEAPDGPLAFKNPFVRRILEAFWRRLESV